MNAKSSLRTLLALSAAILSLSGIATTAQSAAVQPAPVPSSAKVFPNYGKLPLSFEPNRGQVDSSVQFVARGSHYSVLLQPSAATLVLNRDEASRQRDGRHSQPAATVSTAVRMTLDGGNAQAAMSPERMLPGYINYLTSDNAKSHTGIPTYAATRVTAAYPGIDLVYYGTERQLEYDFIVAPQSDPSLIHLAIDGAQPVLEPSGELRLRFAAKQQSTDILVRKPTLYQRLGDQRQPVDGSFTLAANGEIGFRIGSYDHNRELVIDPVIGYGSYFGGAAEDEINGSALNAANQLYAVGQTFSTAMPATTDEFQANPAGNNNGHEAFVTKFSADGSTVLWTTYLGGAADDVAVGGAVNAADQPYIVGFTNSCPTGQTSNQSIGEFPFTPNAVQQFCNPNGNSSNTLEVNSGGYDAFLVQLSSDGKTELYGTPLGGSNNDFASSVAVDAAGKVYIVGETSSTGYYFGVSSSLRDVPSYPVNNHHVASIGQANFPTTSNAYYSNITESLKYATTDSFGNIGGPTDEQAFLTVLSPNLQTILYSSLLGGGIIGGCGNATCNTNGIAIAVNAAGQAFIGGNTSSAHWPTTTGAFAATCSNAGAANSQCPMTGWLAGFDPTQSGAASLLFSTYMNGSSAGKDANGNVIFPSSDVYGLAVDSKGNVVVTGDTNADNFPTTTGTLQPACLQFGDGNGNTLRCQSAYVTKLSPTGATVWSTYFGPTARPGNAVVGQGLALDANDNVFVVGTSTSPTLPLVNAINTNPAQQNDVFVAELAPTAASVLMGTFIGSTAGITLNNNALHLDSSLNAYISGSQAPNSYGGTTFPTTSGAFSQTIQGSDGWVLKLITQQQTATTTLQINPTSTAPGTPITFTATVAGLPGFATPTGTVTLTNGSTTIGTSTLVNGTGTFSTTSLAAGSYSVVATYSGDVVYAGSATLPQTVSIQNTPTVALTVTPSTTTIGTAVVLKATVSSSAGTPTGTVYFLDGFNNLGSTVLSGGTASYSTTALAAGSHSITARYSGDSTFVTVTSSTQTVTINLLTPTVALTASPATATIGTSIALGATVTGTGAVPTGSVVFLDGSTTLSTINLSNGAASYSATALTAGTHNISAKYSGDSNYAPTITASQAVTINPVAPTFTAAFSPATLTIVHGSVGTSTLTLTPANGFAGTLTFSCGSLPSSASCGFSPTSLTFTAASSAAQSTTLSVSTTSAIIGMLHSAPEDPNLNEGLKGIAFAGMLFLPMAFSRRARQAIRKRSFATLTLAMFALMVSGLFSGCSSSGSSTPAVTTTVPGAYTVSVAVTGTPSPTTINLQVIVQ